MHGEVCRVAPDATAFELRKAGAAHLVFWVQWKDPEDAMTCLGGTIKLLNSCKSILMDGFMRII